MTNLSTTRCKLCCMHITRKTLWYGSA